ncbi:hypothetical protein ACJMK2_028403 [Sinanodonta woodiana]|uniref:Uncharacterized protein n=1 Tax=Sinanodonta woodiana TaxID=1069815 RepID=A0ABD3XAI8_SINWO
MTYQLLKHFCAEMEVNRILQNVIVAHHIIQVINMVVGIIICGATSHIFLTLVHLSPILPAFIFVIFWIASQCNYQNLRHILVHFNFILSMLWFMAVFPIFIISIVVPMNEYEYRYSRESIAVPVVVAVLNGILSFSSISFAVSAIWKAARNVVLNAKLATLHQVDGHNGIPMPQVTYCLPILTQR